ncbi:MAG: serine protease [Elusimicrobiaceae bacterium]|nr:serine protease [Elusimicrobiaceae bacterium]
MPAKIVQVSSPGVLDLALVKFPANVERHLRPFELATHEPVLGENLRTMGFAGYVSFGTIWPIYLPDRSLLNKTSLYLRADMWLTSQRSGLCGGPIWDKDGRLVGIHTGTTDGKTEDAPREAHATRATFINTLLDAYHNGGKATVPFELNGQKIVDLEINEAVSYVELLDEDEEVLWEWDVSSKFPYRKVEQKILEHQPRYVDLTTSVVNWEGNILVSRTKHKFGSVSYRYDLLTGQTVRYDKNFWER